MGIRIIKNLFSEFIHCFSIYETHPCYLIRKLYVFKSFCVIPIALHKWICKIGITQSDLGLLNNGICEIDLTKQVLAGSKWTVEKRSDNN